MNKIRWYCWAAVVTLASLPVWNINAQTIGIDALFDVPIPSELVGNAQESKIAWVFSEQGHRNIYVSEGDASSYRKLTAYDADDGQELTQLTISEDGNWVVYVRGGEHGGNWSTTAPANPMLSPKTPGVQVWSVPFAGGEPKSLGAGSRPVISPKSDRVAFIRSGKVWIAPIDGAHTAQVAIEDQGTVQDLQWSPDGSRLAFVSARSTHAYIGVYTDENTPIQYMDPSFGSDTSPRWSPDGKSIVFVRQPGTVTSYHPILEPRHEPWEIRVADLASGEGRLLWKAPETLRGSIPTTFGRFNLHWAAGERIVFLSYHDGWPHLYSVPASGGEPVLLTPGEFMVEDIQLSPDGTKLLFSANTGNDPMDIDRRHIGMVSVNEPDMELITQGAGVESTPVFSGRGRSFAFISSEATRPPQIAVLTEGAISQRLVAADRLPSDFPAQQLVKPRQVIYKAPDGTPVHGQLFAKDGGESHKPAIVFVHGGPQRQMMLGWDHRGYYATTYALNQYLAQQGFVVLSVNYRLGIGYGYEFHKPAYGGRHGISEYQDVKAAGEWLANQSDVDPNRIGIYGGSYGGYLTALALGKDSERFKVGVDIHGVHTRVPSTPYAAAFEKAPDAEEADRVAWESSPIAYVDQWTSPVLLIHGDDDRNVGVSHTVDLVRRLHHHGIYYEYLAIPNETHHWMRHANLLKVIHATVDFFDRMLKANGHLEHQRKPPNKQ